VIRAASVLLRRFADLFFPRACLRCGGELSPAERLLHLDCDDAPDEAYLARERLIKLRAGGFDDFLAARVYRRGGGVSTTIRALKYQRKAGLGAALGAALAERIPRAAAFDAVVGVPLHRTRKRRRGFNQAEEIAEGARRALNVREGARWLRRTRPTPTQTKLDAMQRAANVRGAFEASGKARGKTVLLVDDVATTGATLRECAFALKAAGARRVVAAAYAIAAPGEDATSARAR
jgi:ComF family protein